MREVPVLREQPVTPAPCAPCERRAAVAAELTRRGFLANTALAVAAAALGACGGGGGDGTGPGGSNGGSNGGNNTTTPDGVTVSGNVVTIALAAVPALQARDGFLLVGSADVFVVRDESDGFIALSSTCPHEGCDVTSYSNGRVICPCHGSQFDKTGLPRSGPAVGMGVLRSYPTSFDAAAQTVTVTKT